MVSLLSLIKTVQFSEFNIEVFKIFNDDYASKICKKYLFYTYSPSKKNYSPLIKVLLKILLINVKFLLELAEINPLLLLSYIKLFIMVLSLLFKFKLLFTQFIIKIFYIFNDLA